MTYGETNQGPAKIITMRNKNTHKNGFTFIEVVVAAGVMGILSLAVVGVLFGSIKASNRAINLSRIDLEAEWTMASMRKILIHADSKDDSAGGMANCRSTCDGVNTTQLVVVSRLDGGVTTYSCKLDASNQGYIASTSATTGEYKLSSKNVKADCNNFCITCSNIGSDSPIVNVGFTMSVGVGQTVAKGYTGTFTLRN